MVNSITHFHIRAYYERFDSTNIKKRNDGDLCTKDECELKYRDGLLDVFVENVSVMRRRAIDSIEREHRLKKIESDVKKADRFLESYPRLHNIPWNICIFNKGEFPFPHTHGDTIFLHQSILENAQYPDQLYSTLIHEKVHIFQRLYPLETHDYLDKVLNCELVVKEEETDDKRVESKKSDPPHSSRLNPDTNTFLYRERRNVKDIIEAKWKSFEDTSPDIIDSRDHPYEMMAYRLTDRILRRMRGKGREEEWIKKYL